MEDRMTAQQLKNSILQMAVQGKLVPQDPNDEPASVLLERIRKEKEQLIKEGKIKKNKKESYIFHGADNLHYEQIGKEIRCIEDELPFEIPNSWEWIHINDVSDSYLGKTLNKVKDAGKPVPYLCSINIQNDIIILDKIKTALFSDEEMDKYKLEKNDLLICEGGDVGRAAIWESEEDMYFQNALHRVRFINKIYPYFFLYVLNYYKNIKVIEKVSKGVTIKHFVQGSLFSLYFPLPPINEQKRIINIISELEPLIEKYKQTEEHLYALNSNIKEQLKKSILQYAIEGKLVPQDPNDEPASVLLERIYKEKQKLITEGKIKKDKNESIIYRRDNSYYEKQDKKENFINNTLPFEIPDSWEWTNIDSISLLIGGRDNQIQSKEILPIGDIPVVSQGKKLIDGYCNNRDKKIDVLPLVMFGDHTRNVKYIDFEFVIGADGTKFHKIFICNTKYIYYWMKYSAGIIRNRGYERHYSLLKECYIPLPPIQEQYRIVSKIETLLLVMSTL